MGKNTIRVKAVVNGNTYISEVDRNIKCEEEELIASCKRHIRKLLDEDGLSDDSPDYIIDKN